ncbi:MAG: SHOCT domain-containing protein [Limisphaerales bacterium]
MKKLFIPALMALTAVLLLTGCLELHLGGGPKTEAQYQNPTVGQQLIDLQRARDTGAISAEEYQAQKAKLLGNK